MASRYHSDFSDKKITAPSGPKGSKGAAKKLWDGKERTASWPSAGKGWGSSFNRATRVPVVKTRPAKQDID